MRADKALKTITQLFESSSLFFGHGTDNANDEAWWLMHNVLFGAVSEFNDIPADLELSGEQWQSMERLSKERVNTRKPLAYLINEAWFCGLPFSVSENVLVPRSPIAELIMAGFEPLLEHEPRQILDLCTGSGCIGIACAYAFENAKVILSDYSETALEIARINIQRHELEERVQALHSDLFEVFESDKASKAVNKKFDLIVTNPPYVSQEEYNDLPTEYKREPEMGLVTGNNGLEIPLKILEQAAKHLTADGVLILEVGDTCKALSEARPDLPLVWLEFEQGGHGVCAIKASDLCLSNV